MIEKIIVSLILLSTAFNGITYTFVSKYKEKPYSDFAKYKELNDEYEYKNKQAGLVYFVIGGIIGIFLIMICFLFNLFETLPLHFLIIGSFLISFIIETVLCDTFLNVRFQLDDFDKKNE